MYVLVCVVMVDYYNSHCGKGIFYEVFKMPPNAPSLSDITKTATAIPPLGPALSDMFCLSVFQEKNARVSPPTNKTPMIMICRSLWVQLLCCALSNPNRHPHPK